MTPLLCAQDGDDNGESEDAQAPNAVALVEADGEGEGDDEEAAPLLPPRRLLLLLLPPRLPMPPPWPRVVPPEACWWV